MKTVFRLTLCYYLVAIILIVTFFQNCAPVYSELQSARMVGKNRIEITPSYTTVNVSGEGKKEKLQNHIGFQAAYGISPKFDIRLRYESVWLKEDKIKNSISVLGVGPKFSLSENRIAIYIPIGRGFGENSTDSWQLHPTILATIPALKDKIDVTLAPKYLITFCENCDDYFAINLGVSLSSNLNKWAIRPEYGLLFNPGVSGHYSQFSLGFSISFGE